MIKLRAWMEDDGSEHATCVCWGELIEDAKVACVNKKKTTFTIKWHRKTYANVILWGDTPASAVAESLEHHDMVLVLGEWQKRKYVNKHGEEKEYSDIKADMVIPQSCMEFVLQLASSQSLDKLLGSDESDEMESAGDYNLEDLEVPDDCPF